MKTLIAAAAFVMLAGAAAAQAPAPAKPAMAPAKPAPAKPAPAKPGMAKSAMAPAKPAMGAKTAKPMMSTATTTPTKTGPAAMTKSTTTVKGPAMPRTAASLECSKQADAQNVHGAARKKMMSSCKRAATK